MKAIPLPDKPQFIWVGGALDKHTRLLGRHVRADQHYVQWFEHQRLRRLLEKCPATQIVLIGHSYGASTAAKLVAAGHQVNLLGDYRSRRLGASATCANPTALPAMA